MPDVDAKKASRSLVKRAIRRFVPRETILPIPVETVHPEYSMIFSAHDDPGRPTKRLIDLAVEAVKAAQTVRLPELDRRIPKGEIKLAEVWPGEHYFLLGGLIKTLKPKTVVEIGTATGLSALAMKKYLPKNGKLVTFDVVDWPDYPHTVLKNSDFQGGQLTQELDDLTDWQQVKKHRKILESADFIFVDAMKDGVMERNFLANFERLNFKKKPIVMFDDVRLWNMLEIWRNVRRPKLDLTSFGHWSGTGLIDWR